MLDGKTYKQVRGARSGWGKLWKWSLILWTLFFAFDAVRISMRAQEISKGAGALAQVVIDNRMTNVLMQDFMMWAFGAAILVLLTVYTRGPVHMVEVDTGIPNRESR